MRDTSHPAGRVRRPGRSSHRAVRRSAPQGLRRYSGAVFLGGAHSRWDSGSGSRAGRGSSSPASGGRTVRTEAGHAAGRVAGPAGLADRGASVRSSPCSRGLEHLRGDQRLVGDAGGAHPGILVVPRELVLWPAATSSASTGTSSRRWRPQTATPVVPRVDQDRADGGLAPALAVPVRVASAVVDGWGGDPVAHQAVRDREQSLA
jgi:hypothetical protein